MISDSVFLLSHHPSPVLHSASLPVYQLGVWGVQYYICIFFSSIYAYIKKKRGGGGGGGSYIVQCAHPYRWERPRNRNDRRCWYYYAGQ